MALKFQRQDAKTQRRKENKWGSYFFAIPYVDSMNNQAIMEEDFTKLGVTMAMSQINVIKATPVARKIAADLAMDLSSVKGTGEHGRITKIDLLRIKTQVLTASVPLPVLTAPIPMETSEILETSKVWTTAQAILVREVDATELVALQKYLGTKFASQGGFAPDSNDLLAFIVAHALRQFPAMNVRYNGEGIEPRTAVNVALAVDTPRGLVEIMIPEADTLGVRELGTMVRDLVEQGQNPSAELNGTFTLINLGMFNVDVFVPALNLPALAVLGVGRIVPKPVVKGTEIAICPMLTLCLVIDPRIDSATAARFLQYISELITEPQFLFFTKR